MADAEVTHRLRILLASADPRTPWALGNTLSSVKLARAMCAGARPERGLRLYGRIADFLDGEMIAVQSAQVPAIIR